MIVFAVALFAAVLVMLHRGSGQGLRVCGRRATASPELVAEYLRSPSRRRSRRITTSRRARHRSRARRPRRRAPLKRAALGLVPFWAKDVAIGRRLINARLTALRTSLRPRGAHAAAA
jgi:putative SOS response-associated peptidase YedK